MELQTKLTQPAHVLPLDTLEAPAHCGAKAWRLARMHQWGYPVPPAVVLHGEAFQQLLNATALGHFVAQKTDSLSLDDPAAIAAAAEAIESRLISSELPVDLVDEITTATAELLNQGPVVVRSSACGEDSNEAAFAGQLDSFLNVRTLEQLLTALKRCWASYWSHRSLAYQLTRGIQLQSMGVIIQQQVDARFAGVLFTRSVQHSNQDSNQDSMVLEYCEGLGDRLVTGDVSPRRLFIDRQGTVSEDLVSCIEDVEPLSDELLQQLGSLGTALEDDFEHPQDIEWCVDGCDQLYLVQSRPITTLRQSCQKLVWSNANVNENFPDPISPLLYSVAATGYYHYFRNLGIAFGISEERIDLMEYPLRNLVGAHAGRLYYNLTNIHAVLRAAPLGEFLAEAFNQFVGAESTDRDHRAPRWTSLQRGRLRELAESLRIASKAIRSLWKMPRGIARFEATVDAFADDSHPDRLPSLDWTELLALWRRFLRIRSQWTEAALADAASMISYRLTQRLLSAEFTNAADTAIANRLLTGLCDIVSGLPTERLWDLSRLIRQHESLTAAITRDPPDQVWHQITSNESLEPVRRALEEFLETWGFRCSGELMLTQPSYQEDPASLIPILATYVTRNGESPEEHLQRQQHRRERETERVLGVLRTKKLASFLPWPRKDSVARRLIHWTQRSVACRERARLKQALLYSRFRRLALTVGKSFADRNLLHTPEDIFYLTCEEVEQIINRAAMLPMTAADLAKLRRAELASLSQYRPPDHIELTSGQFWEPSAAGTPADSSDEPQRHLHGTAVSGGTIVGRAIVLTDPRQFTEVQEGDLLVTRQTDPGWGPILFLVRGLVMERGGMLSHGAILAREYGIPTVVGIPNATECITSGDILRIDGDRGLVEVIG